MTQNEFHLFLALVFSCEEIRGERERDKLYSEWMNAKIRRFRENPKNKHKSGGDIHTRCCIAN